MRYLVVVNQAAGSPRKAAAVRALLERLRQAGHDSRLVLTRRDSLEPLREAVGSYRPDRCVAAGGDGTVRDVAQCLWELKWPAAVAVLPLGTANFMARVLGLPRDPRGAVGTALVGRPRPIRLGLVNGQHVFLVATGLGLDAAILRSARHMQQRGWGLRAYWIAALRRLLREAPFDVEADLDGVAVRARCRSLFIVNQIRFPGIGLLTDRRPDDGRLEAGFFGFRTILHVTDRGVRFSTRRAGRIRIRSLSRRVGTEMDGDVVSVRVHEVEMASSAMTFLAP